MPQHSTQPIKHTATTPPSTAGQLHHYDVIAKLTKLMDGREDDHTADNGGKEAATDSSQKDNFPLLWCVQVAGGILIDDKGLQGPKARHAAHIGSTAPSILDNPWHSITLGMLNVLIPCPSQEREGEIGMSCLRTIRYTWYT